MRTSLAVKYPDHKCDKISPEKKLANVWSDIKENNVESINKTLNKGLMKSLAKEEEKKWPAAQKKCAIYSKQMWDSKKGEWVPFDLWGAHFIVNGRKEYLAIRIYRPCDIQPEFGPTLQGWHSLDSSYLNEMLKENPKKSENLFSEDLFNVISGYQAFCYMMKQDEEEKEFGVGA